VALARTPGRLAALASTRLRAVQADVTEPGTVLAAIEGIDVLVSALGISKKQDPQILIDGTELAASSALRVIWLSPLAWARAKASSAI
jgi:uncharacterized protein YbjT (DUF2867 family)